ncbi:hypothetical protein BT96DRAFT_973996 [Gymnopus androsaceus JB14]|uniref:Uncharacterized protein n=1 Tax=Gymnopus androsaceus JB14 TaxID=1447944 RepID=A0A6A4HYQ3_9AGAR|nr:hypothetical protein BT96DRAFT_973996 [Gymnopus androsaceus JB14]
MLQPPSVMACNLSLLIQGIAGIAELGAERAETGRLKLRVEKYQETFLGTGKQVPLFETWVFMLQRATERSGDPTLLSQTPSSLEHSGATTLALAAPEALGALGALESSGEYPGFADGYYLLLSQQVVPAPKYAQTLFEKLCLSENKNGMNGKTSKSIIFKGARQNSPIRGFLFIQIAAWESRAPDTDLVYKNDYNFVNTINYYYITSTVFGVQTSGLPPLPSPPSLRSGGPPGWEVVGRHSKASFALISIGGNP